MIKVYAPHGIFEYPEGNHFAYVTGGELDVVDDSDEIVATFDTGQWHHAESLVEPAEQEVAEPEVKATLTLEDFDDEASWADSLGHTLSHVGDGEVNRNYGDRFTNGSHDEYSSSNRRWVASALSEYGPYTRVVS